MDCFRPVEVDNPLFESYLKGLIREPQFKKILVPCGHCEACIYNSAQEWRIRLQEEFYDSSSAVFFTLTYNDDTLPFSRGTDFNGDPVVLPCVSKRDIQMWLYRLRSMYREKYGFSGLRYYIVSEYGPTTFRPHYHGILFNVPDYDGISDVQLANVSEEIYQSWSNGFVKVDKVIPERIGYVTKYLTCTTDLPKGYVPPFRLMSRRPGIGSSYFDKSARITWHREHLANYYPEGSFKQRLPRYYKRRIFDDDMLADLRLLSDQRRINSNYDDLEKARKYGYKDVTDYLRDNMSRFVRKFNSKYKKSRKDV